MTTERPPRTASAALWRDRRLWALGFLVLLVVPAFFLLARWQLHRLDERRAENYAVSSHADAAPVPVAEVMTAGAAPDSVGPAQEWREITATGRYETAGEQLVRRRPLDGANGFWVVTPLRLADGSVLLVNRGWIAAGADATSSPEVPAAPSGEVTVTGRVRLSQSADPSAHDLPAGQVSDLDVRAAAVEGPVFPAYLELVSSDPPESGDPAVRALPLPPLDDGPHLSYAVQWIAFAVIAVGGFVLLVRGEARRERDESAAATPPR